MQLSDRAPVRPDGRGDRGREGEGSVHYSAWLLRGYLSQRWRTETKVREMMWFNYLAIEKYCTCGQQFGFGINNNFSGDFVKLTAKDSAGDPAGESQLVLAGLGQLYYSYMCTSIHCYKRNKSKDTCDLCCHHVSQKIYSRILLSQKSTCIHCCLQLRFVISFSVQFYKNLTAHTLYAHCLKFNTRQDAELLLHF